MSIFVGRRRIDSIANMWNVDPTALRVRLKDYFWKRGIPSVLFGADSLRECYNQVLDSIRGNGYVERRIAEAIPAAISVFGRFPGWVDEEGFGSEYWPERYYVDGVTAYCGLTTLVDTTGEYVGLSVKGEIFVQPDGRVLEQVIRYRLRPDLDSIAQARLNKMTKWRPIETDEWEKGHRLVVIFRVVAPADTDKPC